MEQKSFEVDLTNCDREPIHIPGAVQAHGVLIALDDDFQIRQISENCSQHFGRAAAELLGQPLAELVGDKYFDYFKGEASALNIEANTLYLDNLEIAGKNFEIMAHRYQKITIVEFEHPIAEMSQGNQANFGVLRQKLTEINNALPVAKFCQSAAEAVRFVTGFDRVMIYRFLEDDSGEVIAEALRDDLSPFLGLRYPASDIPKQARALYIKQSLRFKVDVDDISSTIVPTLNPQTGQPLDLSYAATRAMSPIHVEYLKNMNVAASMSISIVKDGKLWGLIACHHNSPRYISHQARIFGEFLAHTISLQIEAKTAAESHEYVSHLKDYHHRILAELDETQNIRQTLIAGGNNLLKSLECGGAALVLRDEISLIGATPGEANVQKLIEWLWAEQAEETVFATRELAKLFPKAADYAQAASGVLAVRLTRKTPEYIIWFRPEERQTVKWAGNPEKPVTTGQFGARLTPRQSFEVWKTEVRGQSAPWKPFEIEFAETLRRTVVEIILRRIDELIELNRQLETSNTELDSFAYVASHDLKEPLRGINNYSTFLIEDYAKDLEGEAVERLQTLVRLTERMETLLDSLLHYSRVGRLDLQKTEVDLNEVLQQSLLFLRNRIADSNAEIVVPRLLPKAFVDEIRVGEVFSNLISNALKYTDQENPRIEIGYTENETRDIAGALKIERVYYVRDNGIGIDERFHSDIFRIFKRLHGRKEYSGGVGAGLTIVKRIVERHGGRIWLESATGEGTIFYFTLEEETN